jgi:peptidoglycan LD-endopeptidase CwlK
MDARSTNSLKGVHPDLVKIFTRAHAMAEVKPVVTEGLRTVARQRQLVAKGASKTMNSRHITGHALDVAFIFGKEVRWDWPLYKTFADVMKRAAKELGLSIEWGGDWKSFKDGPHFQLPFGKYPK